MSGYVPGEQPNDPKIVKLNTNENPYLCAPEVQDILSEINVEELAKYPDPVCTSVRKVIAEKHTVGMANIIAGNGSDELLALCIRAFVEPNGGSVGFFDPTYSLYTILAGIEDVETKPVALTDQFGWQMPADYDASVFFLTNPNAPTGMLFPKDEIEAFIQRFKGVVVIDEAYADFASEDCMDFATKYENVIVLRTLSKSYALAGIRFGYAVGCKTLIDAMYKIKDSYNINMITQELARVALNDEQTMQAMVLAVKETRIFFATELANLGFTVYPSEANFLWVKPPANAEAVFKQLRQRNVFVRWFAGERTKDYLRITVGTQVQMMELIEAVEDCLGMGD